jgi:hypothetical protein
MTAEAAAAAAQPAAAKSPTAMPQLHGSTAAAGTAAAVPAHIPGRMLTRCAISRPSPTW